MTIFIDFFCSTIFIAFKFCNFQLTFILLVYLLMQLVDLESSKEQLHGLFRLIDVPTYGMVVVR